MANTKVPSVLWNVSQDLAKTDKEKARDNIGVTGLVDSAPEHKFVTGIAENSSTGNLSLTTGQPNVSDISDLAFDDATGVSAYDASSNKAATVSSVTKRIGDLNKSDSATTNNFVTSVSESAGVITVSRAQPTISNISGLTDRLSGIDTAVGGVQTNLDNHKHKVQFNSETAIELTTNNSTATSLNHSHGNITTDGKIANNGSKAVVTDSNGTITTEAMAASSSAGTGTTLNFVSSITQSSTGKVSYETKNVTVDSTYSESGTNPINGTGVKAAIDTLTDTLSGPPSASNTITSFDEVGGKVTATFAPISITKSQVSDFGTYSTDSFKTIKGTIGEFTASGTTDTLTFAGSGAVSVTADSSSKTVTINAPSANNGKLILTIGGESYTQSADFTANASSDVTYNIPRASYDDTVSPVTYSAGVMTGQDKQALDNLKNHGHGFIAYDGTITPNYGYAVGDGDRLLISRSSADTSNPNQINYTTLSFNTSDTIFNRYGLSQFGAWSNYQTELYLAEVNPDITILYPYTDTLPLRAADTQSIAHAAHENYANPNHPLWSFFYSKKDALVDGNSSYITYDGLLNLCTYLTCDNRGGEKAWNDATFHGIQFEQASAETFTVCRTAFREHFSDASDDRAIVSQDTAMYMSNKYRGWHTFIEDTVTGSNGWKTFITNQATSTTGTDATAWTNFITNRITGSNTIYSWTDFIYDKQTYGIAYIDRESSTGYYYCAIGKALTFLAYQKTAWHSNTSLISLHVSGGGNDNLLNPVIETLSWWTNDITLILNEGPTTATTDTFKLALSSIKTYDYGSKLTIRILNSLSGKSFNVQLVGSNDYAKFYDGAGYFKPDQGGTYKEYSLSSRHSLKIELIRLLDSSSSVADYFTQITEY